MAETIQQLLRERIDDPTPAVKYADRVWTWREHLAEASTMAAALIGIADPQRPCTSARCWATPLRCSPRWPPLRWADTCFAGSTTLAAGRAGKRHSAGRLPAPAHRSRAP
ncbi:acyl-CoA synthetase domain protein [Mycobacterium xenopi 4042]|uniref:Acyl-CoA synthetase domain protein n=1 Tax=Mycobacterium xenopi 4042 TaxID=1299334 RepID=X8E0N0_MYCXE|nr:acyl-CoA synthetase domain protein [Mycobacterium xenopi 4042]